MSLCHSQQTTEYLLHICKKADCTWVHFLLNGSRKRVNLPDRDPLLFRFLPLLLLLWVPNLWWMSCFWPQAPKAVPLPCVHHDPRITRCATQGFSSGTVGKGAPQEMGLGKETPTQLHIQLQGRTYKWECRHLSGIWPIPVGGCDTGQGVWRHLRETRMTVSSALLSALRLSHQASAGSP